MMYAKAQFLVKNSFYPDLKGNFLLLTDNEAHNRQQIEKFSKTDFDALHQYHEIVDRVGAVISNQWMKEPP